MRIADKMQFNQVNGNIQKNRSEMADLQNQAATQRRINKPSDDPLAAARVLGQRTEERTNTQFTKNVAQLKNFLEFTDQSLGQLTDIFVRAKELAVGQATDGGASAQTRRVVGAEIAQLFEQAVQLGNSKLGDRFIFAGYQTQTRPFDSNGSYHGDQGDIKLQMQKEAFVTMNMPGSRVFLGKGLPGDGVQRPETDPPLTVKQLGQYREEEEVTNEQRAELERNSLHTRGPAALGDTHKSSEEDPVTHGTGINILQTLKALEIAMKTNDKEGIQEGLETVEQAMNQVIQARSEVGSRMAAVNNTLDGLHKAIIDNKSTASQLEDADVFQVVSDMNKTESTLKATLETSGKMIQPSLMDFLK